MTFKSSRLGWGPVDHPVDRAVKSEHLREIGSNWNLRSRAALDLEGVTVVGVNGIHFLGEQRAARHRAAPLPGYVREWISRKESRMK